MSIQKNWKKINDDIAEITDRDVTVMAVTKKNSPEDIREIISAGAVCIGENRVDAARKKFIDDGLYDEFPEIELHMIGHLQTRKVKDAVKIFDCIQSVESEKTAHEINKRCAALNKKIDVLIEVNVSGEIQKAGVSPFDTPQFVECILHLENLNLKGLMTMAPFTDNESVIRSTFSGLRELRDVLSKKFGADFFQTLSMGMSNDYKIAVEEGSTMVRIGTALFN
jgi:pyridoxal phosphate enzyme (YggS family)